MDNLEANIMEKSMRSVFVGNIPYDINEETLKGIFSEVGQVVTFRIVYDRDDGKPKGYGFCEFSDQETALSAIRNLNGYEMGGRKLRVDNACTEKSRMELMNLLQQPSNKSPYGESVSSDRAPEAVCNTVSTLPPERMLELLKQMKESIAHNPTEMRRMLMQNPQLAYALLQTQVAMDIIDPTSASRMLHPSNKDLASAMPHGKPLNMPIKDVYQKPLSVNTQAHQQTAAQPMQPAMQPLVYSTSEPVFTQDSDLRFEPPPPLPQAESSRKADPRQRRADPRQKPPTPNFASFMGESEQEKAALIMQVLQLTDEQIAMLPPDQRQSIQQLKSQLSLTK